MCGGSTTIQQPAPPTAPTASQTAEEYAKALPIYYQSALQYEPQIAQMQKGIQQQLYPYTTGLQENIAQQAQTGMNASIPEWYKSQVSDTLKSQFGRNLVYNPQGQEQYGLATQQAYKNWQDYYTNLGLSVTGRQPLTQPSNMMQSYTPAANMGYAQQGYGTQAGVYGQQLGGYLQQQQYNPWMNVAGSLAGGVGGAMTSYGMNKYFPIG